MTLSGGGQGRREGPFLRVTLRCLVEDIGRSTNDAEVGVEDIDHELLRKFVELRSQHPRGVEKSSRWRTPRKCTRCMRAGGGERPGTTERMTWCGS